MGTASPPCSHDMLLPEQCPRDRLAHRTHSHLVSSMGQETGLFKVHWKLARMLPAILSSEKATPKYGIRFLIRMINSPFTSLVFPSFLKGHITTYNKQALMKTIKQLCVAYLKFSCLCSSTVIWECSGTQMGRKVEYFIMSNVLCSKNQTLCSNDSLSQVISVKALTYHM